MMKRYKEDLSAEELVEYPVAGFEGNITLITTDQIPENVIEDLKGSEYIGFDTETRPSFKKGVRHKVALLQLSNNDNVYLFRLNMMGLPESLTDILEDETILKVGVAIRDDIKGLKEHRNFEPGGFIELQNMVGEYGIKSAGLKKLSAIILGHRISKRQQVSNWERDELSEPQLLYAATDAWVCYRIYTELLNHN